jgi:tol-pal system protein YbgF
LKPSALLLTIALFAVPAAAQDADPLGKRVGALESQMRAVQRKVFPGGDPKLFAPEVAPAAPAAPEPVGVPASSAVSDLSARVDALEQQLRTLTGQVETLQFKQRQLEDASAKLRGDVEFRLNALEQGHGATAAAGAGAAAAVAADTVKPAKGAKPDTALEPKPAPKAKTDTAAWKAAYESVTAKDWEAAAPAMEAFLADWPKSAKAPEAQYWLGRANAEQQHHAEAARAYLDGYKAYPKSDRAADSLIGLAKAMQALKKPKDSCRVLGELDQYGKALTGGQKSEAKALAAKAKCEG